MRSRHVERMKQRAELVGPDGMPVRSKWEIPFVRIYPDGTRGLQTIDGLQMLVGQAAAAFELFFGTPAPREYDAELRALLTA